jgi:hypothetical protein
LVGEKDPSYQVKRVQCPRSVEGSRQEGELRLGEFLPPPEQAHDDKEGGKKRTPEFRHRDKIWHGGDNSYGKDADRKIGPSPEGYGPHGGGPRYLLPRRLRDMGSSAACPRKTGGTQRSGPRYPRLADSRLVRSSRA